MAMFDFLQDAGERITANAEARDAEAEAEQAQQEENMYMTEQLSGLLQTHELMSDDMTVTFEDGLVTLCGTVDSAATQEKIIIALGNVYGVAQVDDQLIIEAPAPAATLYTVQRGDSLSKIAAKHYGKGGLYKKIFEANRPMLKDPNKIYPGQVLRIPPLD